MENTIISSESLSRQFKVGSVTINALHKVSFTVKKNEFVALMGASGSGKSTLMNLIGCLDTATSGSYNLNGTNVKDMDENALANVRNKEIGFIFQTFNLLPRYTALENVMLPLVYAGIKKQERIEMAKRTLESVGLSDRIMHTPNELSGGQRQRVAIARALVNNPSIILADEPTGNLDPETSETVFELLIDLVRNAGIGAVIATHNMQIAERMDRILELKGGKILSY
jgi:putative ABC transport system ATP-binding protein